jgi:hypothetical protein
MAKRRISPSSAAKGRKHANRESQNLILELASPVASIVNLEAIVTQECSAKRGVDDLPDDDNALIDLNVETDAIGRVEEQGLINISISFLLRGYADKNLTDSQPPVVEIASRFLLVYRVLTFDGLSDENLYAFATTSGVFSVWPYWREFVHSSSFRLSIRPIVLPTYRR